MSAAAPGRQPRPRLAWPGLRHREGSLGLAWRGLSVLGVELDPGMAEMARGCRNPGV